MKIVFFGNTKYSRLVEEVLHKKFKLAAVVTIPDKPKGRNRKLTPSATKEFAQKHRIPVLQIEKIKNPHVVRIAKLDPDFFVVADYGLILPPGLLKLPRFDSLNVHHSLLPKYRGPAPAPTTILNGDKVSGVTVISMTYDVDAGDILAQEEYQLTEDETTDSLLTKLNTFGANLVSGVIENYQDYKAKEIKQDESKVTYTHRFSKTDGQIDPANPPDPQTLDRMIRAFYPWPTVWTKLKTPNSKLKTFKFLPGNLILPEGKRPLSISEFKNGYPQAFEQINHLFKSQAQS